MSLTEAEKESQIEEDRAEAEKLKDSIGQSSGSGLYSKMFDGAVLKKISTLVEAKKKKEEAKQASSGSGLDSS